MAFIYCTILICVVCLGTATCNTFELLREACPYSNFCTTLSIKSFNKTDTIKPCCYDCYCDEHCSAFGDCCPDYKGNVNTSTNLARIYCKTIYIATEQTKAKILERYTGGFEPMEDRYRVIDFCPDNFNEDSTLIEKCNGSFVELPQFADLVVVSDGAGRMFKNKYCAFCHGVRQLTSWQMKVMECSEDFPALQLTLSQARYFLINFCLMTSARPRGLHATARSLPCPGYLACNGTDRELAEGCVNGPFMPYFETGHHVNIYKNVLCYKFCSEDPEDTICTNLDALETRLSTENYQLLLNLRAEPSKPVSKECGEAQVVDMHTGECRRLYCPPFDVVAYGHCVHMSTAVINLKLSINIIYTMTNTSLHPIIHNPEGYNETLLRYFIQRIDKKYGYPECSIKEITTPIYTDDITGRFAFLVVNIAYEMDKDCTIEYIAERLRHSTKNGVVTDIWLIQDAFLKMDGRFSFFDPPVYISNDYHYTYSLLLYSRDVSRISPMDQFFLCPYFKLSFDEYSQHLKRRGQYDVGVDKPSLLSRYEDGFYPASESEIIVCVDTYQSGSGSDTARAYLFIFMALLVILI